MGYLCEFCGDQRSMVYCRSDAACLCLSCDRNVHSANALSRRHSRTLICERCNSQPAIVRCPEERVSLCQNCDWLAHGASVSTSAHKRQSINSYSGCPSASELSAIWSFALDSQSTDGGGDAAAASAASNSTCEQKLGLMNINENSTNAWAAPGNNVNQNMGGSTDLSNAINLDRSWGGLCSIPESSSKPYGLNLPAGTTNASFSKSYCTNAKALEICEDDDLYKDFDIDEVDLTLENYEELFGMGLSNSEDFFENGGMDSLFGTKDMSAADSNGQGVVPAEGSSVGLVNEIQPACSNAASADSIMSTKTEPIRCFSTRQGHSIPGITGESSADHQDCGASSMFLLGEPPWCPPCPEGSLQSANRTNAVMRYKEKKKIRKFEKRVRYASRKERADVRRRVKGRFVKAGDAYDYDPMNQTRSF